MDRKFILASLLLIAALGCTSSNTRVKMINSYWTRIVAAADSASEHQAVADLHDYIRKEQVSFEAFFETENEKLLSLQDHAAFDGHAAATITIRFYPEEKGTPIIKSNWRPKAIANAYYLYNE